MKLIKLVVLILGMMSSQCVNAEWSDFLETFTSMWSGEQYEAYFNDRPWTLTAWLTYMGVAFDTTWDEEYEEYDPNNYDMSIGSVYEVHNDLPWRNGDPWLVLFYTDGCKKCDAVLDWYTSPLACVHGIMSLTAIAWCVSTPGIQMLLMN